MPCICIFQVSFSVSQLPSIQSGSEYTCRFDEVVTDTIINGMNFTCMTPAGGDRPDIPDGESKCNPFYSNLSATLGIRDMLCQPSEVTGRLKSMMSQHHKAGSGKSWAFIKGIV